jgi:archaellum component FlaC
MTTADYEADPKKLDELMQRVEKLEQHFGIEPKTWLESIEEPIEKLERSIEPQNG